MKPRVSVVVPCFNEARTIDRLFQALVEQTFPHDELEVIIADGMSNDGTRKVIEGFSNGQTDLSIKLVDNRQQTIPTALNKAIAESKGEVVIRLDAHSVPDEDYIAKSVAVLNDTGAANVGGLWEIRPVADTWIGRSIAAAAAHPLSAGDARYRIGGKAGEVDTVPFGAFPRKWLDRVGPFNEELLTNEDYEYNVRLKRAGGIVWFDPSIRSTYFARPNFSSLFRQYARYGYWKSQMLRLFPGTIRGRQAGPPLFVLGLLALLFAGLFQPIFWTLLSLVLVIYGAGLLVAGVVDAVSRNDVGLSIGIAFSLATIHLSWGGGFLWGMIRPRVKRRGTSV